MTTALKEVVILKKPDNECPNCKNLGMFLDLALGGKYNDKVDFVRSYEQPELYYQMVEDFEIMSMPAIIDLSENKVIATGFNPAATNEFLLTKFG